MKEYNIITTDGDFKIMGTRHEIGKYFTVYNGNFVVFEIRFTKVKSYQ